jgi:hypothetical protein
MDRSFNCCREVNGDLKWKQEADELTNAGPKSLAWITNALGLPQFHH